MSAAIDAVIVGAGPAGSATAILLARAGWSVALIEKQRFPRRKVCGECIAASNMPLLAALGVQAQVDTLAGPPIRRVAFMRGARSVMADMPASSDARYPWGRALGRETLDTLLAEQARAAGVALFQPWSVDAIDGTPGDWTISVRQAESTIRQSLHCAVAIDAHGSWESLRANRKDVQAHRPSDLIAFKANFSHANLLAGLLPVLAFAGGYGGMVVGDGNITTLACCVRRDRLALLRRAMPDLPAGAVVETYLRQSCRGVDDALRGARREGAWLASGPLKPGIRLGSADQPFRVGNAAGEAHPIIGEGMSMALQGGFLLGSHLISGARGRPIAEAAWQAAAHRGYRLQWRRLFAARLTLAAAFSHAAMRPATGAVLMAAIDLLPGLLPAGAHWAGKTRCAVDAGSLSTAASQPAAPTL